MSEFICRDLDINRFPDKAFILPLLYTELGNRAKFCSVVINGHSTMIQNLTNASLLALIMKLEGERQNGKNNNL